LPAYPDLQRLSQPGIACALCRADKRAVLKHHPDKNSTVTDTEADRERKDGFFTCIKKAYEVLNDVKMRRLYDSVDMEGDDVGEDVCVSGPCNRGAPRASFVELRRVLACSSGIELGGQFVTYIQVNYKASCAPCLLSRPSMDKSGSETFFEIFGPVMMRNGKWLDTKDPVPPLGDASTPKQEVDAFYEYFYSHKSWREFG